MSTVDRDIVRAAAAVGWASLSPQDRNVVRFGMIPSHLVGKFADVCSTRDGLRVFAVELMEQAKRDGGMVA